MCCFVEEDNDGENLKLETKQFPTEINKQILTQFETILNV